MGQLLPKFLADNLFLTLSKRIRVQFGVFYVIVNPLWHGLYLVV